MQFLCVRLMRVMDGTGRYHALKGTLKNFLIFFITFIGIDSVRYFVQGFNDRRQKIRGQRIGDIAMPRITHTFGEITHQGSGMHHQTRKSYA